MENMTKRKKSRPQRRYDVEMIRDFLEHLLWEVRIAEDESDTGRDNPEHAEQLALYMRKYGSPDQPAALLPVWQMDTTGCTSEEIDRGSRSFRKMMKGIYANWRTSLESLKGLFESALQCAAFRGGLPAQIVPLKEYLEKGDGEPEADADS